METTTFFLKNFAFSTLLQPSEYGDGLFIFPRYAMIIIAGVILALIFQIIFVVLSVSLGISAIGDFRKKFVKASNHTGDNVGEKLRKEYEFSQDYNNHGPGMGENISTAFGVWSMITTSLALLFGTMLALNLATVSTFGINVTLALVIWAIFFLILFYLEIKFAQTIIGGLFSTVVGALKNTSSSIQQLFSKSPNDKIEETIDHTIEKFRKELVPNFNSEKISNVLEKFLNKVDKKMPDYDSLKNDIKEIAKANKPQNSSAKWMAVQQVLTRLIEENSDKKNDNWTALAQLGKEIKEQAKQENSVKDGATTIISEHTNYSKEDLDKVLEGFKNFVGQATPSNLNIENIQSELNKIFKGEETVTEAFVNNFSVSREDLLNVLKRNTNIPEAKLEEYADTVEKSITDFRETFSKKNLEDFTQKLEERIKGFLNMDATQNFDATALKNEFVHLINNPSEAFENIKYAIANFNRNDFETYLVRNNLVSQENINKVSDQYEAAVAEVKSQVEEIEIKARQAYEMTKRKAVIQAEHARKTAAIAAWWLLITILVAGATSVLGVYSF
ncbi:hypothetical protein QRD02_07090 [Aequorivita sp. SDUM287046]|uniref:Uncharacterized protein n=1 Tax=Aequorivita aurantiaca TaxID=3053356 RepID=A0ABT8DFL7_9FLAO|nr:hypothetical protein [Aequorivita aurantiaca]MDN3724142.1 hypothetical protein [Aequorivita aurantiaca]